MVAILASIHSLDLSMQALGAATACCCSKCTRIEMGPCQTSLHTLGCLLCSHQHEVHRRRVSSCDGGHSLLVLACHCPAGSQPQLRHAVEHLVQVLQYTTRVRMPSDP